MTKSKHNIYDYLKKDLTTITTCWRITLSNGELISFTEHDKDITINGIEYKSDMLISSTAMESRSGLIPNNLDIELSLPLIDPCKTDGSDYEEASVEVELIDFANTSNIPIQIFCGYITSTTITTSSLKATIQSYSDKLNNTIGEVYSPLCRADFCDFKCKLSEDSFSFIYSITKIIDKITFFSEEAIAIENGLLNYGKIKIIEGVNLGMTFDIKENINGIIIITTPPIQDFSVGSRYKVTMGCDKKFETCINRFNNAINFRGEPNIPGYDELF